MSDEVRKLVSQAMDFHLTGDPGALADGINALQSDPEPLTIAAFTETPAPRREPIPLRVVEQWTGEDGSVYVTAELPAGLSLAADLRGYQARSDLVEALKKARNAEPVMLPTPMEIVSLAEYQRRLDDPTRYGDPRNPQYW